MKLSKISTLGAVSLGALALATSPAQAATVVVDLSGATTGTTVTGDGASFAQGFSFGPLALAPSGSITVAAFDPPGPIPGGNSLLSQPGNSAPLAMLLDGGAIANSITLTVGSFSNGTVDAIGYDTMGNVTGMETFGNVNGYDNFTLSSLGNFAGVLFTNISDPAGVRFQNISYETVMGGAVPEPATWAMMLLGFFGLGAAMRTNKGQRRIRVSYS